MMLKRVIHGLGAGLAGALCLSVMLSAQAPTVVDAAQQGDREAVRALLREGRDVNATEGDGLTALHWAALREDADLAQMLVFAGANVRATTRLGGYTPLMLAAQQGSAPVVDVLLKAGSDPKATTSNGTTPLMLAAAAGRTDAITALIDAGSELNATETARGETALMFAAANGRVEAIRLLASRGADPKATSKVTDLNAYSKELEERFGRFLRQNGGASNEPAQGNTSADGRAARVLAEANKAEPAEKAAEEKSPASAPAPGARGAAPAAPRRAAAARPPQKPRIAGVDRNYLYNELVAYTGGMTPLHLAARQGHMDAVKALVEAGADVNQVSAGDRTSPLLIATINGEFDLAKYLLDRGADPTLTADNGVTPLYAALNCQWAPKANYPQPRAYTQQHTTYLDLMTALLDKGADPNVRLKRKVWYSGYNFDLAGVDEIGATPFWRAAYASDVDAMKLLVAHGADPNIPTMKPVGRPPTGDAQREVKDVSSLPPVPVGGPGVPPLVAQAGTGYSEGFAANSHRTAPGGFLPAAKYLVEVLHADVNAHDHEGNTALHNAASRGDVELIAYLVSKGADVKAVNREGQTTVDMANGPVQRTQPFPEAIAALEKLGAKNNHKCVSC